MRISRKKRPDKPLIPRYNVNDRIPADKLRVLDTEGNHIGIMSRHAAIALAQEHELDLVEINPKTEPPVAQITEFGSFKYQKEKEARKQKINSHVSEIKGVRLSVRIGEHDLDIRRAQAEKFLNQGDKVKAEIILRGRENAHPVVAFDVIRKLFSLLLPLGIKYEQEPAKQGNKVTAIIVKK